MTAFHNDPHEEPDDELVRRALQGDEAAFQKLVERYEEHIKKTIRQVVRFELDDVDDIFQDVCIRAFESLSTIKDPKNFKAWISRIARNMAIDYIRKRQRHLQQSLDKLYDKGDTYHLSILGHEIFIADKDFWEKFYDKLQKSLPKKQFQCLILYSYGWKPEGIARRVGIQVKSVPVYIHQARKKARKILVLMIKEQEGGE